MHNKNCFSQALNLLPIDGNNKQRINVRERKLRCKQNKKRKLRIKIYTYNFYFKKKPPFKFRQRNGCRSRGIERPKSTYNNDDGVSLCNSSWLLCSTKRFDVEVIVFESTLWFCVCVRCVFSQNVPRISTNSLNSNFSVHARPILKSQQTLSHSRVGF